MNYQSWNSDSPALFHVLPCLGSEESCICLLMIFSIEGPCSLTYLTDSESRLSKFTSAITSFRWSCGWKDSNSSINQTVVTFGFINPIPWAVPIKIIRLQDSNKFGDFIDTRNKWNPEHANSQIRLVDFDHQQKIVSLTQYQGQEPEVFPKGDTSHS